MRNLFLIFMVVVLCIFGCNSSDDEKMIFKRLSYDVDTDEYSFGKDSIMSNQDQINIVSTFIYYGIPVERDSMGRIFVSQNLMDDLNYLWNLSNKSQDESWLRDHVWKLK